jgi:hypothetical protein
MDIANQGAGHSSGSWSFIRALVIHQGASQECMSPFGANNDSSKLLNNECESGFGILMPDAQIEVLCSGIALNKTAHYIAPYSAQGLIKPEFSLVLIQK